MRWLIFQMGYGTMTSKTSKISGSWISVKLTNRQVGKNSSKRRLPLLPRPWGLAVCPWTLRLNWRFIQFLTWTNSVVEPLVHETCDLGGWNATRLKKDRVKVEAWCWNLDASRIGHVADSPVIQLLEDQEWKACSLRSTMPSKVPSWNSEHGKTCTKDGDIFFFRRSSTNEDDLHKSMFKKL